MALFGKSSPQPDERSGRAPEPAAPASPSAGGRPEGVPARAEAKTAVIGPHVRIQGELSGDDDVVVEGRVEGKIHVTKLLRIGASAAVNAEVTAQTVIVAGRVVGNVTGHDRVELLASANLEGNIRAPKVAIAEGAQFKGSVEMGAKPAPGAPAGAPPTPEPGKK